MENQSAQNNQLSTYRKSEVLGFTHREIRTHISNSQWQVEKITVSITSIPEASRSECEELERTLAKTLFDIEESSFKTNTTWRTPKCKN